MIIPFDKISDDQAFVGSKAFILAKMSKKGLPVPEGLILSHEPDKTEDWQEIYAWWKRMGSFPLAVRSSAFGEDSKEMSFAGQNQSFLNVQSEDALRDAILQCFLSIDREASKSYRKFFTGSETSLPMNVVLQRMVKAQYSGVYFSVNPLNKEEGAVLEYTEGLGEKLVSGQINPYRFSESQLQHNGPISIGKLQEIFKLGTEVSNVLREKIDMEWAIDFSGRLYFLQARPITASRSIVAQKNLIQNEYERIRSSFSEDTWWDGQTFCEWSGTPSQLSYDVWKRAFTAGSSFDLALREMGYRGFDEESRSSGDSILDQLFGRPFVNMAKILPLYFGPIPYEVKPKPKAHLSFSLKKVSAVGFFKAPVSLLRMIKVGWNLSTRRRAYIQQARKELLSFASKSQRPTRTVYENWSTQELMAHWKVEIENFSDSLLKWPLVVAVLIEATERSLEAIVKSIVGPVKARDTVQRWMGSGVKTLSFEMGQSFKKAAGDSKLREFVIARYGHRGPGEMDLCNPRWEELGLSSFDNSSGTTTALLHNVNDVEEEVHSWKSIKETVVLEEWRLLKDLLELREQWKMEHLKPYAHIRYLSLEISKRLNLGLDIFCLTIEEIENLASAKTTAQEINQIILQRKEKSLAYKSVYLADTVLYSDLYEQVFEPYKKESRSFAGLSLSGGRVKGRVKIVNDLSEVQDINEWPADTILLTKATDPGWTPILTRVKGVVVERGGILSHCAIVAREMSLPAINLGHATHTFKDGDFVFLDADKGTLYNESRI